MKRKIIYLILTLSIIGLSACKMDSGDDLNSLPTVDVSKYYKENSTEVNFPKGTNALDIYTCLYNIFGDKEINVKGTYTISDSHTYPYEAPTTKTKELNIVKIKLTRQHDEVSNSFNVYMETDYYPMVYDDKAKKWVTSEKVVTFNYCYEWQYHNTNAWQNNKCEGKINIQLPSK